MQEIKPNGLYTASEVATLFELEESALLPILEEGAIAARLVGGKWFLTGAAILDFVGSDWARADADKQRPGRRSENPASQSDFRWSTLGQGGLVEAKPKDEATRVLGEAVRRALDQCDDDLTRTADWLNNHNIRPPSGRIWSRDNLKSFLQRNRWIHL